MKPGRAWGAYSPSWRRRLVLLLAVVFLASGDAADASDRYDPRLRFRTLQTEHFEVHFHQGEEALATRVARLAEAVATGLEPKLGRPRGPVHVILVNQHDLSNGWATPIPQNVIEILAAAPRGTSLIGNSSDWIRLVFTHEYTHILHLDRSRGLFGGLRRVFGRHPALLPNLFVPPWQTEGLATFYESANAIDGRVPNGEFREMLNTDAASNRFASLDRAGNLRVDWPSGNTPYLYGAYFHDYLARRFGDGSLAKLADATAGRLPYFGAGAFTQVFGESLGELWKDFEGDAESRVRTSVHSAATRLTHHGFNVSSPTYSPDGKLFYSISNPHGFPALMALRRDGQPRQVATRVGGGRFSAGRRANVFDQLEYVRSVGMQSDLYTASPDWTHVRRLTREARAGDPDLSPDGRTLVCTIQEPDRRYLATLAIDGDDPQPKRLLSEASTNYASPRWSPDGRSIVAERQRTGSPAELVIIDVATREVKKTLAPSRERRSVAPSWTPDGEGIVFSSDREGGPFQVFMADVVSGELRRLANAGDSAQSPVVSPDGRTLTFVGYTGDGYDLFSLPWDEADWQDVEEPPSATAGQPTSTSEADDASSARDAAPYHPGRQLLPRFWTPIIAFDDDETSFGAATGGSDALGRHAYAAGAAWSTAGRPDWYAVYVYDRWRPRLFADTSESTDAWLGGAIRTRELNVGARVPFRTFRRSQSLFASFHLSSERFDCSTCDLPVDTSVDRRALRGGWSFTTAKEYGYSISAEDGWSASMAGEWSPAALSARGAATALVMDVRGFVRALPRHGVFAVRAAAATAWGDEEATRIFGAAGSGPRTGGASFDRHAIGLIRGFDADDVVGRRAAVVNAEYRVPLAWIERGVGTWPLMLRSVHAAAFVDAGAAWNERLTARRRRASAGLEISADVVIGYVAPLTLASGVAWRDDPTRRARGAVVFARVGRAF